ncbi:OmpA family protein [Viscerimonas tarda]
MKKVSLLLFLSLVFISAIAQNAQSEKKAVFVSDSFWSNWFIGAGARGNVYLNGATGNADLLSTPTLGGELFVGKWFSPAFGARLTLEGGSLHPFYDHLSNDVVMGHQEYAGAHVDALFNLTNVFRGYNPDRFYNFIPYVGVGAAHGFKQEWKSWKNNSITFNAGLLNTFRLSSRLSAYLDIKANSFDDQFDGYVGGDINWDALASGSVGLTYAFGKSTQFVDVAGIDPSLIDDLNAQINRLRAENAQLAKRPVSCPDVAPAPAPAPQVSNIVGPGNVVFFRLNSANIDSNQQINIYNTAKYLKDNAGAKVKIVGYADKKTGTASYNDKLSEKRAKNVAKALIEKYNISSDRVKVEWKGSSEQPYAENAWNRVAIFFAE